MSLQINIYTALHCYKRSFDHITTQKNVGFSGTQPPPHATSTSSLACEAGGLSLTEAPSSFSSHSSTCSDTHLSFLVFISFQSFTHLINLTFQGSDLIHKHHHRKESVTESLSPGMGTSAISWALSSGCNFRNLWAGKEGVWGERGLHSSWVVPALPLKKVSPEVSAFPSPVPKASTI